MLYITSSGLIYLITGSLYLLIPFTHFTHPPSPPVATTCLFSCLQVRFFGSHVEVRSHSICHPRCHKGSPIFIHKVYVLYKLLYFFFLSFFIQDLDFFPIAKCPKPRILFRTAQCSIAPSLTRSVLYWWTCELLPVFCCYNQCTAFLYPSSPSLKPTETVNCSPSSSLSQLQCVCSPG